MILEFTADFDSPEGSSVGGVLSICFSRLQRGRGQADVSADLCRPLSAVGSVQLPKKKKGLATL